MTDWINDLAEPYRTLALQLLAHTQTNPNTPFSPDKEQTQTLCT